MSVRGGTTGSDRRGGRWALVAALGLIAGTSTAVVISQSASAATSLQAPERLYTSIDTPISFTGQDSISGDERKIVVGADDNGCDTGPPAYSILGCPNITINLQNGEGGTIEIPGIAPEGLVDVAPSGAVVTQLTETYIVMSGTADQLNADLDDLIFTPAADYEEDGTNATYIALQLVDGLAANTTIDKVIEIRVEGVNGAPTILGPSPSSVDVAAATTTVVPATAPTDPTDPFAFSVVDPELCQTTAFTPCPQDIIDAAPGIETDDEALLVVVAECGAFSLRSGAFTSRGGQDPDDTVSGDEYDSVQALLELGEGYRFEQVTAVLANLPPWVSSLNLAPQQGRFSNELNTVFAGVGPFADVRYVISQLTFDAPEEDSTCAIDVAVSDLGNNGMPTGYIGTSPNRFEVPDAKSATSSVVFNVTDEDPDVTIASSTVGPAGPNKDATFLVTFSEDVTGFDAGDVVFTGSTAPNPSVVGVTGGPAAYTVEVEAEGDGTITASIPAGAAQSVDTSSPSDASPSSASIVWDQTEPTTTIALKSGQPMTDDTSPIEFTVTFSEPVDMTGFDADDINLLATSAGGPLVITVTPLTATTAEIDVTGMSSSGTVELGVLDGAAVDLAANESQATTSSATVTWEDGVLPTPTIDLAPGQPVTDDTSPIEFVVTFDEPITGSIDESELDFTGTTATGTLAATITEVAGTFEISITGMVDSGVVAVGVDAGAVTGFDGDPSAATAASAVVAWDDGTTPPPDVTPPTVTVTKEATQADPTNESPVVFTVEFSEPVSDFTAADVTVGGTAGATSALISGSDTTYTVAVSGMSGSGTVTAQVLAGKATDAAGNPNVASNTASVVYDVTAPTVTINQAGGQADPTNGTEIDFTVVFSEPVTGFTEADVNLSGSALATTKAVDGSGTTYTVTITGMQQTGTVTVSVPAGGALDAAGNANLGSSSTDNTVTYDDGNPPAVDVVPPTVTINQAVGQADPTSASAILFDVVFSEPVTGFTGADVNLSGTAGATTRTVTGSGAVYTVTITGMTQSGTVIVSVPAGGAGDAAGNLNLGSSSTDNSVQWDAPAQPDTTAPTVTIDQAAGQADPTSGSSIAFTAVFTEPVLGFTGADVTIGGTAGATTAAVSGGPSTYTVTVTGMTNSGTVTVSIASGVATDGAGNGNEASTSTDNAVTWNEPGNTETVSTPGGNATIAASGNGSVTSFTNAAPSVAPPTGVTFPYGQFSFTATTSPGGIVTFTLDLPGPVTSFYKLVSGAWEAFTWDGTTGAQITGDIVTIAIQDNGRGDGDPTPGVILDPGAPGQVAPTDSTTTTTTTTTTTPGSPTTAAPTTTTAGSGTPTPTSAVTTAPATTRPTTGGLPATGGDPSSPVAIALVLLVGGGILAAVARRRRVA